MISGAEKADVIMRWLERFEMDAVLMLDAVCDENRDKSYALIVSDPDMTAREFFSHLDVDYDEEDVALGNFVRHLLLMPHQITEVLDEDHYDLAMHVFRTQPDITREDFLKAMRLTNKYKGMYKA